jgi:hypothetical protein
MNDQWLAPCVNRLALIKPRSEWLITGRVCNMAD